MLNNNANISPLFLFLRLNLALFTAVCLKQSQNSHHPPYFTLQRMKEALKR